MKTIHLTDPRFAVTKPGTFRLKDHVCDLPSDSIKKELKKQLETDKAVISELQEVLYAAGKHAVLMIFQAMDAAGKDSCIRHVMSGVNPQGVDVRSFKAPSTKERDHDFLWRHALAMPERGFIGIHNRSHYEEVLVTRVHPEFILGQKIPGIRSEKDITKRFWEQRYASIRNFEEHLAANGTVIMKFFLHMGKDAQKERFLERIDDPRKNWKFSVNDVKERRRWDDYQKAYEQAIRATAAPHAPWYIIPADEQWESRALVGRLLRLQLEALGLKHPALAKEERARLADARKELTANDKA